MLSGRWNNICVVGDFSQSIYSFRGADFLNLAKFKDDFKDVKTFLFHKITALPRKYWTLRRRLSQKIIRTRFLKLWTENETGEEVIVRESLNEQRKVNLLLIKY